MKHSCGPTFPSGVRKSAVRAGAAGSPKIVRQGKNHLTEVRAAIAAIRSLEEAAETEDTLPSETELQEKLQS